MNEIKVGQVRRYMGFRYRVSKILPQIDSVDMLSLDGSNSSIHLSIGFVLKMKLEPDAIDTSEFITDFSNIKRYKVTCNCASFDLFNFGCKCGAFNQESSHVA